MTAFPGSIAFERLESDCATVEMYGSVDEYESSIADIPRESLLILSALNCDGEVCNGGFRQFFRNTTGILAPEAVDGYELLGFPGCANALRDAMALFPCPYPRDRWERHRIIEELEYPGGDPKLITEYEPDINAIMNKMHLMTRKPFVRPFDSFNDAYFSIAGGGAVGAAADAFVTQTRG